MNTVRLTPENVFQYIGYDIIFKTRKTHIITRIDNVSATGKTIYVKHPDLQDNLQIVSRIIYVIT
jgi:hypothetical protein